MYIIFDLDDTLLNYERKVDDVTLACLHYFQNKGHKLVINTARSLINTKELMDIIKPDFTILYGGSLIVDKNYKVIFKSIIEKNTLNSLIKDLINDVKALSVETIDDIYCDQQGYRGQVFDFKNNDFNLEVYKLLFCSVDKEFINKIREKYDLNFESYHNLIWHRFVNNNVSKALGIKELLNINGGSLDDCIAFGDDFGDIEMINECGVGVCMKNASDLVKSQIKGLICDSNNDFGVARFLLNYFREKK